MMFVDESGDTGYPSAGGCTGWGGSTLFARVGVILHGWKWKAWHDRLTSFKRNRGLTRDAEIKASDNLLQVADVCTNVFYREMAHGKNSTEFQAIQKRFWRRGTRLQGFGIKKWP